MSNDKFYAVNYKIREKELRVITQDGENLGVISTEEALKAAQSRSMDLVVIAPNATPPVAKILDFKKFLYQERKERTKAKIRSKKTELKEIRFKPFTGDGDLGWQMERGIEWLKEGNRVKVWVQMRGREQAHPEVAFAKMKKFEESFAEVAKQEGRAEQKGNIISTVFIPK